MNKKNIKKLFYVIILMMSFVCVGCGNNESKENANEQAIGKDANLEKEEFLSPEYPILIDDGKLEILSIFKYTGINSDAEDVYCEEIGAIQLKNVSGKYLEHANIEINAPGNIKLSFVIEQIPDGAEVIAFDVKNQKFDDKIGIEEINAETKYIEIKDNELIPYSVNGNEITIKNITDKELKNIAIYYHCNLDTLLYGGKAYELNVDSLSSGQEITITDTLCYLGDLKISNVIYE